MRRTARSAGVAALLLAACRAAEAPPPPAYDELLSARSGMRLTAEEVATTAHREADWVETRLEDLARQLRSGGGWRAVYSELRRDHPASLELVLAAYRHEVARARAFVAAERLLPLPAVPLAVVATHNAVLRRTFPLALWRDGRLAVIAGPPGGDPVPMLADHCRLCIPPLAVHEGYPGHHAALAGRPPAEVRAGLEEPFFLEGWGQYAEVLMLERGYYRDPAGELAAWRLVLLRARRAEIDALLARRALTPTAAAGRYRRELLMSREAAAAEVERHLAAPTAKASYLVGMLQIIALRREVMRAPEAPDLESFHRRLLAGPAPLAVIAQRRFGVALTALGSLAELFPGDRGRPVAHPPDGAVEGTPAAATVTTLTR